MKHKILGYAFIGMIFAATVALLYHFEVRNGPALNSTIIHQDKSNNDTVFCGGIAGLPCPTEGYICEPEGSYPDAGTNCRKDENWTTYQNAELGFQFEYPTAFAKDDHAPAKDGDTIIECFKSNNEYQTSFCVDLKEKFSLELIQEQFSSTGLQDTPPKAIKLGENEFYMYGPGGGGVMYPDQYFYNLNGRLLIFRFIDGKVNDKTPSLATKALESGILATFKITN